MIFCPSWSRSTSSRRVAAFAFVNVGLSLWLSGGTGAIGLLLILTGHAAKAWPWLIVAAVSMVFGAGALWMMWVATVICNQDREMDDWRSEVAAMSKLEDQIDEN